MKNFLLVLFAVLSALPAKAQMSEIFSAIQSGDAIALSKHFDETVEVCILEGQDLYNKKEAAAAIQKFFGANKPTGFQEMHQGSSKGKDSKYTIGQLTTSGGTYRVYLFMKQSGARNVIQEIRFDRG